MFANTMAVPPHPLSGNHGIQTDPVLLSHLRAL